MQWAFFMALSLPLGEGSDFCERSEQPHSGHNDREIKGSPSAYHSLHSSLFAIKLKTGPSHLGSLSPRRLGRRVRDPQGHFVPLPPEIWIQAASRVSLPHECSITWVCTWGKGTVGMGELLGHHFSACFFGRAAFTGNPSYSSLCNFTSFPF